MEKVSVIIPVYNVEDYIDQCLLSVCNQTYYNLEIILIYDKSSDSSYEKCLKWIKKDLRIKLIYNQSRKGLGIARNQAILEATGDYIVFLDSDDWMEESYIQKLCKFIKICSADVVVSSEWYEVRDEKVSVKSNYPEMVIDNFYKAIGFEIFPTAWGKLFKREWILKYDIFNPPISCYEDWSTLPLIILQASCIGVIQEPGIFYRILRPGSLTDSKVKENKNNLLENLSFALEYFLKYAVDHNVFVGNELILEKYFRKMYVLYFQTFRKENNLEGLELLKQVRKKILLNYFPDMLWRENIKYYVLGSFSLRWELQKTFSDWKENMEHYCFSSVISVMTPCENMQVVHENIFRQEQIKKDIEADIIQNISKNKDEAYFLIDFLEERYDVLEMFKDQYCTCSEAWTESNGGEICSGRRIKNGTPEYWSLWKKKCIKLIEFLNQFFEPNKIVLVRNKMALVYGKQNDLKLFKKQKKLQQLNKMIKSMEDFFLLNYPGITVIDINEKYLFSDEHFYQGCRPEHINNAFYEQVSLNIYKKLIWEKEHDLNISSN